MYQLGFKVVLPARLLYLSGGKWRHDRTRNGETNYTLFN